MIPIRKGFTLFDETIEKSSCCKVKNQKNNNPEEEGFEPSACKRMHQFSKLAPSTTRSFFRGNRVLRWNELLFFIVLLNKK
jgi:hypothetical protein